MCGSVCGPQQLQLEPNWIRYTLWRLNMSIYGSFKTEAKKLPSSGVILFCPYHLKLQPFWVISSIHHFDKYSYSQPQALLRFYLYLCTFNLYPTIYIKPSIAICLVTTDYPILSSGEPNKWSPEYASP